MKQWLAIHLPRLSLESLAAGQDSPLAVSEYRAGRQQIIICNQAATLAGVSPGMPAAVAPALSLSLRILPREPGKERAALEGVAVWASRFTSHVALAPPHGLLLELAGSRRLFGGFRVLLPSLQRGLGELGYGFHMALAPTPEAALLLARSGRRRWVTDLAGLRRVLGPLPLALLPLPSGRLDDLQGLGLRSLDDLLALPPAGLRRRIGSEFMDWLERLLGRAPDPRPRFQLPDCFQRRIELPAEVCCRQALLFPARRLLLELSGFLTAHQAGTQRLAWTLGQGAAGERCFHLGLLVLERDPDRLLELLRERLERVELSAPVREIALEVRDLQPLAGRPLALFAEVEGVDAELGLLERLRMRLGVDAVSGLQVAPDHRPERAWRWADPGSGVTAMTEIERWRERPLWLLPEPRQLRMQNGHPWLDGRLELGVERERIESGWWDERPVARDYFMARTASGRRLWVYQELHGERGWFLHGYF